MPGRRRTRLQPAARRPRGPTVLVYHPTEADRYRAALGALERRAELVVARTPREAAARVADVDIVFAWGFPRELYAAAPRLRWLQLMGAGVDAALVPELPSGVTITRAPGVFGPWMAEYVVGWCAWVTQRMDFFRRAQAAEAWRSDVIPERLGGKTLAVVGLGDIGRAIARAAGALGMRVIGVSRSGRPAREASRVWTLRGLRRALAEADFAVLVLPLTDDTRGLVGAAELAALRPSAWLLNVGRGGLVDEPALIDALRRRTFAGAILDVVAAEPLPAGHPLWTLDNVVLTPHISGPSTPEEITPVFADNLRRWLAGRPLRHVVDRRRGY